MKTLAELNLAHRGQRALVCGLGPSVELVPDELPDDVVTIGVNDVARHRRCDYVLVMDRPETFGEERLRHIRQPPRRRYVFGGGYAHFWEDLAAEDDIWANICPIQSGSAVPPWHDQGYQIHKHSVSPITATSLAGLMGCRDVGVIGVDLVDHPRITDPDHVAEIGRGFGVLSAWMDEAGYRVVNLSPRSAITSLPSMPLERWLSPLRSVAPNAS